MEKKNPFKFTLGFDKTKASHIRAVELLNTVKDKADLIAEALVSHVDGVQDGGSISNETLQALIQEFVRQEVQRAMQLNGSEENQTKIEEPKTMRTSSEETYESIDPRVVENVRNAMSAFRRR